MTEVTFLNKSLFVLRLSTCMAWRIVSWDLFQLPKIGSELWSSYLLGILSITVRDNGFRRHHYCLRFFGYFYSCLLLISIVKNLQFFRLKFISCILTSKPHAKPQIISTPHPPPRKLALCPLEPRAETTAWNSVKTQRVVNPCPTQIL